MSESKTPRTDALSRDHYYEASALEAGMCVSAKSPEDCYRELHEFARTLELELSSAFRRGQESMRERCAKIADSYDDSGEGPHSDAVRAIRALPILDSEEGKK